ncbi:MAG: hypothetical protein WCC87_26050 [Candidatus Korobacteraceae bacterium]
MASLANPINTIPAKPSSWGRFREYLQTVDRSHPDVALSALGLTVLLLLAMAAAAYGAQVFLAIVTGRHLYGDGSWFLVKMLSENHVAVWNVHGWHDFFAGRFGAFAYQEYPTLLAARLHVHNLKLLSLIYGVTLFSFKPLSILLCYRFARDKRLIIFPLLTLFAITMNSEVYLVTETHLMSALFWPALFGLMYRRKFGPLDLAAMVIISAPLLVCYESMAIYGLILCAACIYRYFTVAQSRREKWLSWVFFAWYALGVLFAVLAIVFPRDVANRQGFLKSLLFVLHNDHIGARVSCIVLILCALIVLIPERYRTVLNGLAGIAVLCSLAIPLYIVRHPEATHFGTHVIARTMNASAPLALAVGFVVLHFHLLQVGTAKYQRLFVIAAVLGMCQSGWSMVASTQWSNMLTVLRAELRTHSGPVPFENTPLSQSVVDGQPIRNLHADWPLMSLSILYSDHRAVQTILLPPAGGFEPFNPYAPAALPDLSHFGVRYDLYREALKRQGEYVLGETLTFNREGNASPFLRGDWASAEDWATWSDGPDFGLDLPLSQKDLPDTVVLRATVAPNLSPKFPGLAVQVSVNDVPVGNWSFQYSPDAFTTRTVPVPATILTRANPVRIRFHIAGPLRSPSEMGKGPDPRKLGLAFLKASLEASQ